MKLQVIFVALLIGLVAGDRYADNDMLYEKAMNMLEQQIQLLRNFVNEVNHVEGLKNTAPIWRGISNVFTDLSGMFGSAGRQQQYHYETYGMFPPSNVNATELARKARLRVEHTRRDIVEMNDRITKIINEAFGPRPYGNDYHKDRHTGQRDTEEMVTEKQRDEQAPGDETTSNQKTVESTSQKPVEKEETFRVADGFLPFELPVRGAISRDLLKEQLYQEEFDMISGMSPRNLGKIIKPLIAKGQINANVGQCHVAKLLNDEKPITIEP